LTNPETTSASTSSPEAESSTQIQNRIETDAEKSAKRKKKKKKKQSEDPYREFQSFSQPITKIPHHRLLAINRGERAERLRVKIVVDEARLLDAAIQHLIRPDHPFLEFMKTCARDALNRLIVPSLEREIRRELTEAAERHAVQVFAHNLKNLLLQAPARNYNVLAIDPGYKRGCSVVALDSGGRFLESDHIFVVGNQARRTESKGKLVDLLNRYDIQLIAIGNGAACRETEQMISDVISECPPGKNLRYAIVNEAGASFYSTSEIGREELSDLAPTVRSAVSIGRRLIEPLSELVKISPANIGVGLYQHDVKAKHLNESLDEVVEFCVNRVGVNVNTASPSLLRYVSGLNQLTARRVYEYRVQNGAFRNREQLKQVTGFGEATFIQAAGFLRILGGDQCLDSTSIHPESYPIVDTIFKKIGATVQDIFPASVNVNPTRIEPRESANKPSTGEDDTTGAAEPLGATEDAVGPSAIDESGGKSASGAAPENVPSSQSAELRRKFLDALRELDANRLAEELNVGQMLIRDILYTLCKPEFDPRNNINRPIFRTSMLKFDDVKPQMCLEAQVVNVVDFGVFVDIGLGTSCLVHVSQLANHFIRDPHRYFGVGDVMKVWVTDVDSGQRRIKLTAIRPAIPKPAAPLAEQDRQREPRAHSRQPRGAQSKWQGRKGGKPEKFAVRQSRTRFEKTSRPAKPVKPITQGMLSGVEPMRSFSDLAQFFNRRPTESVNEQGDNPSQ
jgi:uncharacterized protein